MKISVFDTFESNKLKRSWSRILSEYGYFLQNSYEWCMVWWKYFSTDRRFLCIIVAEEKGEIVGISPMFVENRGFFRSLRFVGSPLTDFHDFLIVRDERYRTVLEHILDYIDRFADWDIVLFEHINSENAASRILERRYKRKFLIDCPIVEFEGLDWSSYLKVIRSRNLRADIKKKSRRIARDHAVRVRRVTDADELLAKFDDITKIHIARWSQRNESSKFHSDRFRSFVKEVFVKLVTKKSAVMWLLCNNERIIAYRLGFLQGKTYYDWNTGFDHKFYSYSPGKIITAFVIRDLIEHGYTQLDFMRGGYFYKKEWMPKDREHVSSNYLFVNGKKDLCGVMLVAYYSKWRDLLRTILKRFMMIGVLKHIKLSR